MINIRKIDWFVVSKANMIIVAEMFSRDKFTIPSPRCFSKKVNSFDLILKLKKVHQTRPSQRKLVFDKIMNLIF